MRTILLNWEGTFTSLLSPPPSIVALFIHQSILRTLGTPPRSRFITRRCLKYEFLEKMPGCAAPNCSNRSNKGFKLYRFPADLDRRKKWLINCRRADWKPTQADCLCSVHFEASQFEQHRADGKRFLMPFAVPTLFSLPNPPKKLHGTRKSANKVHGISYMYSCAPTQLQRPHQIELRIEQTDESLIDKKFKLDCEFHEHSLPDRSEPTNDENHATVIEVAFSKKRIIPSRFSFSILELSHKT